VEAGLIVAFVVFGTIINKTSSRVKNRAFVELEMRSKAKSISRLAAWCFMGIAISAMGLVGCSQETGSAVAHCAKDQVTDQGSRIVEPEGKVAVAGAGTHDKHQTDRSPIIDDTTPSHGEESVSVVPPEVFLLGETLADVWRQWVNAVQRGDLNAVRWQVSDLAETLRSSHDDTLYQEIARLLNDSEASVDKRLSLVDVLQAAATPQSMQVLLTYMGGASRLVESDNDENPDLRRIGTKCRDAIGFAVGSPVSDEPNWALSEPLEKALKEGKTVAKIDDLAAIAQGIAFLGTPSGTQALIEVASSESNYDEYEPGMVARKAIGQLKNIDAVPILQTALTEHGNDSELQASILQGLISIGSADASLALIGCCQNDSKLTDEQFSRIEAPMLARIFPEESLKVFLDALPNAEIVDDRMAHIVERVVGMHSEGIRSK
jgi:hypothetical protein